jgi:hypothetical protein
VTQAATGFTRTAVTAENGAYSVPNLEPGTYAVTVEMPGFANVTRSDLLLTAGLNITLDMKMQVAGLNEEVVVTGESPLVEKTSNQIGGSPLAQGDRGRALELPQLHGADPADSRHHPQPGRIDV